jgi:uncharacterized protein (TIGR03067 family)
METNATMKTSQNTLLVILAGVATLSAWAEETDAIKKDMAQLQGEWTMASGSANGYAMPDSMLGQSKRICKGDDLTVIVDGRPFMKAKITIDPTKKPKTIDYHMTDGFTKGKTQLGIYELDGDTFKSCFAGAGDERPADFTSKAGDNRTLSVWKRQRPSTPTESKTKD